MFSLAKRQGKYLLACRIQPWTEATSLSLHVSSIAWRRDMRAYGWRLFTFLRQAEKNSSMESEKVNMGVCTKLQIVNGWQTSFGAEQLGEN